MKAFKKIAIGGLLALLSAFSVGGAACALGGGASSDSSSSSSSISDADRVVVEFEDQTIGAAYGSDFSIAPYLTAVDNAGMPYMGSVELKDSEGNVVELFENRFYVTDLEGYSATVTVTLAGTTYTKTITVNVEDRSLPVISMAGMKQGSVGQEYVIPTITVSKVFDTTEIIPTVKVYYMGGGAPENIELTDGRFTPTKNGEYRIEVTAVDKYGTKKAIEESFSVRKAMAANMLEDFDDENNSLPNAQPQKKIYGQDVEWLESYEGATGVIKTRTQDGFTPRYGQSKVALKTGRTQDELAAMDFDYINVRVFIPQAGTYAIGSHNCRFTTINGGEWSNIQISRATIEANAQWLESLYVNKNADDPYGEFVKAHSANGNGDYLFHVGVYPDGPEGDVDMFRNFTSSQWTAWIAENADAYEEMKQNSKGVEIYIDSISYAKFTVEEKELKKGEEFTIPAITMTGFENTPLDIAESTTVSVTLNDKTPITVTDGKFTPTAAGSYAVTYTATWAGVTYQHTVNYLIQRVIPKGFLEDFGDEASTGAVYVGSEGGSNKVKAGEWLESYTAGEVTKEGVLKVDISNSSNPALWLKFNYTVAELEALNIQSIKITLSAKNANASSWVSLYSSASSGDTANSHGHSSKYAGWGTIEISIDTLKAYARIKGEGDGSTMDWSSLSIDGDGAWLLRSALATTTTLYIDSIEYTTAE